MPPVVRVNAGAGAVRVAGGDTTVEVVWVVVRGGAVAGAADVVLGGGAGTVTVTVGVAGLELWVPQAASVVARSAVTASLALITKA